MGRGIPRLRLDCPLVAALGGAWGILSTGSRIYLHVLTKGRTLALCTTALLQRINQQDTDIVILMVRVFPSGLPDHDWFLQTKKNKFVNVSKVHDCIGNAVGIKLAAVFVLSGCDTVSCFYRESKKAILERVLNQEVLAVELPSDLGEHTNLSETSEEKLKRFVQIFAYGMYVLMYVLVFYLWLSRRRQRRCSVKKDVIKNFEIFTGKHLCWRPF